ncbi:MAG: cytochrome P450, partial [Natronosporangium sp.]
CGTRRPPATATVPAVATGEPAGADAPDRQPPDREPPDLDLVDPELYARGDPYARWRWLRRHDPVHWHPPSRGMPGFWTLTRYRDVLPVLGDPAGFSSAAGILLRPVAHGRDHGGGSTLALTDPPRHRRLRAVVQDFFTERMVRRLRPQMQEIAVRLLDRAGDRENVDFVEAVAARLPLFVICRLMGVPDSDRESLFALTSRAFGAELADTRRAAHTELMGYFLALADRRRAEPGADVVSALATARVDGLPLTDRELILNCDNVLVGGTENVRIAAAGGLLQFLREPVQWQALRRDPQLLAPAVEEVLRYTSTPTHILRTAVADVTIRGRRIGAGEPVTLWLPSANRDEEVFDAPEVFDIRRSPNRHLALGTGEHFCLGGTLARAELRVLFGAMASRPAVLEPAGEPTFLSSIVVNGPEQLPVRVRAAGRTG